MGLFSRFESKAEDVVEGGGKRGKGGIEPVKLAKRAFKEMQREKMVGVGAEYAPTLYNVLVSAEDDAAMSGYYPSLAGEIETYLAGRAESAKLVFDCPPLVRFIVDDGLKRGKFDVIAESVSAAIIADLRDEEMEHYGLKRPKPSYEQAAYQAPFSGDATLEQGFGYEQSAQAQPAGRHYQPDFEPAPAAAPASAGVASAGSGADAPAGIGAAPWPSADAAGYEEPQERMEPAAAAGPQPYEAASALGAHGVAAHEAAAGGPEARVAAAEAPAGRAYPPTEAPVPGPAHLAANAESAKTALINPTVPTGSNAALLDYKTQTRTPLSGTRVIIGRGTSCDVIVSDASVSRHHAELLHDGAGWLIRDTGSTNGTFVNGAPATQSRVYNGDIVTLGAAELEFQEG